MSAVGIHSETKLQAVTAVSERQRSVSVLTPLAIVYRASHNKDYVHRCVPTSIHVHCYRAAGDLDLVTHLLPDFRFLFF